MTDPSAMPMLFVVGNSRSGTTMMGRMFGRHPRVFTFNELHFFEQLWDPRDRRALDPEATIRLAARLITIQRDGFLTQRRDLRPYLDEAAAITAGVQPFPHLVYAAYLRHEASLHGADIPCEQTPRNVFFMREILALFPQAHFINMVRDPRDVLLSQKNKWRRRFLGMRGVPVFETVRAWSNYHPMTMALIWNGAVRAGEALQGETHLHQVQFERLLAAPAPELQALCAAIGLDYQPEMLEIPQVGSSHGSDHADRLGVNPAMAGRWQSARPSDRADLAVGQVVARRTMQRLGYQPADLNASPLRLGLVWLSWPFKTCLAFLLNLGRSRSLLASIRRRLGAGGEAQ